MKKGTGQSGPLVFFRQGASIIRVYPRRGVVAVACVPTLVEGGGELKRYGVPAPCVLLDYSGCKKHWHPEGVPTSLNFGELRRILEDKV
jgi:hypothetical protein